MNIRRSLVRLYPHTWRERYEEEFLAMLEQRLLAFQNGVNPLSGIVDAHLHPALGTTGLPAHEKFEQVFFSLTHSSEEGQTK